MRLIEIVADAGLTDTLSGIADQNEITDYWCGCAGGRRTTLVPHARQRSRPPAGDGCAAGSVRRVGKRAHRRAAGRYLSAARARG